LKHTFVTVLIDFKNDRTWLQLSMNTESQEGQYIHTNSSTWATNFLMQMGTLPSTNKRWRTEWKKEKERQEERRSMSSI